MREKMNSIRGRNMKQSKYEHNMNANAISIFVKRYTIKNIFISRT